MIPPLSWLTDALGDGDDDPWCDVDVPEVLLSAEQHDFLSAFADQPAIPRLRGVGYPPEEP
jgi:hypothetical protein